MSPADRWFGGVIALLFLSAFVLLKGGQLEGGSKRALAKKQWLGSAVRTSAVVGSVSTLAFFALGDGVRQLGLTSVPVPLCSEFVAIILNALGVHAWASDNAIFVSDLAKFGPVASTWRHPIALPATVAAVGVLSAYRRSLLPFVIIASLFTFVIALATRIVGFMAVQQKEGWTGEVVTKVVLDFEAAPLTIGLILFFSYRLSAALLNPLLLGLNSQMGHIGPRGARWPGIGVGIALLLLVGSQMGSVVNVHSPLRTVPERVLFSNFYNGIWGRSDRSMSSSWFGDYSVYNHSHLVDLTRQWADVSISNEPLAADLSLDDSDVLVLATPSEDLSELDLKEVVEWVESGGHAILIGDHTDINGSSRVLNRLTGLFGAKFQFDSIVGYPGEGYARSVFAPSSWMSRNPWWFPKGVETLTPCSIRFTDPSNWCVVGSARSISIPGHYGSGSNFGSGHPSLTSPPGPHVLAATRSVGAGRLSLVADGTMLTSFAAYRGARPELWESLICLQAQPPQGFGGPSDFMRNTACCIVVALCMSALVASTSLWNGLAFSLAVLWVAFGGRQLIAPEHFPSRGKMPRVEFLWKGGQAAFPYTIGPLRALAASDSFDSLSTHVTRMKRQPVICEEVEELTASKGDFIVLIAPTQELMPQEIEMLRTRLDAGASLMVVFRRTIAECLGADYQDRNRGVGQLVESGIIPGAIESDGKTTLPGAIGMDSWASDRTEFWVGNYEDTGLVLVGGAEGLSRSGIGHSFSHPTMAQRRRLRSVEQAMALILETEGQGL